MTNAVVSLKGDALLQHVAENKELITRGEKTRTEVIVEAGYVNSNGTPAYTEYYTEVLNAQGVVPVVNSDVDDAAYEALSGVEQDLYDAIHDKFGEKWDHEDIMEFMELLDDIGITTPEQLDDAYKRQTDEYNATAEFAEYYVNEVMCTGIPSVLEGHIDWDSVWDFELRCDYNSFEFDGETFFFRNI